MASGKHYGSFAGGFINAYLQARRLRMQQAYYEALIAKMDRQGKGNYQDQRDFDTGRGNAQGLGGGSTSSQGGGYGGTRGMRNNNPGNIEDGDFAKGLPGYQGSDGRFAKFDTMEHGTGALDNLLTKNYSGKTVREIINKYAPPGENNSTAYANTVAKNLGIDADSVPNLNDGDTLAKLRHSIVSVENGIPYERVPDALAGRGDGGVAGSGWRPTLVDASKYVNASGGADATQLHPAFANRVAELSDAAYKATGTRLSFNELHRTHEQQAEIRVRHEAMPGGVEAHPAAQAGHSYHEIGAAGDMDDNAASRWARTPGPDGIRPIDKVGLETLPGQTGANDPFHVQLPKRDWDKMAQNDAAANQPFQPYRVASLGWEPPPETLPSQPSKAGPLTAAQMEARRREIGNIQLAPPGPDQTGQYGINAVSQFAHLPNAPQPPAPRQDNITPPLDSRQSDPRAVPQDDSSSFGRPLTPRQAPYDSNARSIESQPTFPPVQGRELGPENVGSDRYHPEVIGNQPIFPPVQGREVGPENAGRDAWTPDSQPTFPPVSPPAYDPLSSINANAPHGTMGPPQRTGAPPNVGMTPSSVGIDNPATRNMPYPGQRDPRGVYAPKPGIPTRTPASDVPAKNAQPVSAVRTAPRAIPAPDDNGRFVTVYRPNADPTQRGRQGAPLSTALNLSGLFGGRQPQPQLQPQPVPAPRSRPVATAPPPLVVTRTDPTRSPPVQPGLNPSGNLVLTGGNQPNPRVTNSVPVPYPPPRPDVGSPAPPAQDVAPDTTPATPPAAQSMTASNGIPPGPDSGYATDMAALRPMDQDIDQGFMDMAARKGGTVRRYANGGMVSRFQQGGPAKPVVRLAGGGTTGLSGNVLAADKYMTGLPGMTPVDLTGQPSYYYTSYGPGSINGAGGQALAADWARMTPDQKSQYSQMAAGTWQAPAAATPAATATPAPKPPPPPQPTIQKTVTLNPQAQVADWTPPNTTAVGNSFTGNTVAQTSNTDTGTNFFGPSYNAGSFNQTAQGAGQFGAAATPTTSLLDDGGGVSASPMGMPPGLGGGQQQTPPIYYNPAVYSASGAPINRGVSQNSVPSFAAMAVPTYQRGGGVMRFADGGGVDDPEGDQIDQQMMYDGRMAEDEQPAAPSSSLNINMPNETAYRNPDAPAPDAQNVSLYGGSYPTGGIPRMTIGGSGGLRGPRMSVGGGGGGRQPPVEDIGSNVDLDESSPAYGQPRQDQGPIDQNGDASPGLLGALAGAIQHIFGQTQPGQTVPGNSSTADARRQFVSGEGGERPEDIAELHREIDPSQSMDNGMRNLSGLYAVYNHHLMNGDVEGANRAASSMLIYSSNLAAKYGDEAVKRFYKGDMQGTIDHLKEAFNATPNGEKVDATPNQDGSYRVTLMNQADKIKWEGDVAPREILGAALGMQNKSLFWHTIQTQAAQAGNVGARQALTNEDADASASRVSAAEAGGGGGGSGGWASYKPSGGGGAPESTPATGGQPRPFATPPAPPNPADHPGEIIRADTPESTAPAAPKSERNPAQSVLAGAPTQDASIQPATASNADVPSVVGIPVSEEQEAQNISQHWQQTKGQYLSPEGYPVRGDGQGGFQVHPPPPEPNLNGLRPAEAREVEGKYKADLVQWDKDRQDAMAQAKADQARWESDYRYANQAKRTVAANAEIESRREQADIAVQAREDKRSAAQITAATTADTRRFRHENFTNEQKRQDAVAAEERAGYTKATEPMSLEETNKIFTGAPTDVNAREDNEPVSWLAQALYPNDAYGKPITPKDAKVQFGTTFKPYEQNQLGNALKIVQSANRRMPTEQVASFVAGLANGNIMASGSEQPLPGDAANGNRHVIAYANKDGSDQGIIYVPSEVMQNIVNIRNAHPPKEQEAASPYANDYGRTMTGVRPSPAQPMGLGVPDQFGGLSPAGGIPSQNATPESTEGGEAIPRPATRGVSTPIGPPSGPRFGIAPSPGGHGGYNIENAPADIIHGIQNHPWFNPPKVPRGRGYVGQP